MAVSITREAVGVFHDARSFEAAADDLLIMGFDRSLLSLMASVETVERELGHLRASAAGIADDPLVPRVAFFGSRSRTVLRDALAAGLIYAGATAAAGVVVASGGTVGAAIAAAAVLGGAGGTLGLAFGRALQTRHGRYLAQQIEHGGILLWVRTLTPDWERRAVETLERHGAAGIHVHDLPAGAVPRIEGVSRELAWINKPLAAMFAPARPNLH
ncbi:MAG TPA: hypothetical protein VMU85_22410 [Stellaceae bacterium]|nr:hypothetical protein [Stellaceae bacterium]